MNIYTVRFWAKCPANGIPIDYTLKIETGVMIRVEELQSELAKISEGFHEHIADALFKRFGGRQTIKAEHHGVMIETIRPFVPHWIKPSENRP